MSQVGDIITLMLPKGTIAAEIIARNNDGTVQLKTTEQLIGGDTGLTNEFCAEAVLVYRIKS